MRLNMLWLVPVLLVWGCSPDSNHLQRTLTLRSAGQEQKITVAGLKSGFKVEDLTVEDYNFGEKKNFRAVVLTEILQKAGVGGAAWDEILFRSADGYAPSISAEDFKQGKLNTFYVAFGENRRDFFTSKVNQGKAELPLDPFYIISIDKEAYKTLSWPYQVIAIELTEFKKIYDRLYVPELTQNPELMAGFTLFRQNCVRCHSLNLQGGEVGPELNIPRNITEYRDDKFLRSFIRNASAFRAKSKMPPFLHLPDADVGKILGYLRVMKGHKKSL